MTHSTHNAHARHACAPNTQPPLLPSTWRSSRRRTGWRWGRRCGWCTARRGTTRRLCRAGGTLGGRRRRRRRLRRRRCRRRRWRRRRRRRRLGLGSLSVRDLLPASDSGWCTGLDGHQCGHDVHRLRRRRCGLGLADPRSGQPPPQGPVPHRRPHGLVRCTADLLACNDCRALLSRQRLIDAGHTTRAHTIVTPRRPWHRHQIATRQGQHTGAATRTALAWHRVVEVAGAPEHQRQRKQPTSCSSSASASSFNLA